MHTYSYIGRGRAYNRNCGIMNNKSSGRMEIDMKKGICILFIMLMLANLAGCGNSEEGKENIDYGIEVRTDINGDGKSYLVTGDLSGTFISGCAKKSDTLILQDFWNKKETADKDSMKFVTGLEIIFPKEWQGNIVTDTGTGSDSNTISICEKGNAEAGIGGAVFYLNFFEYTEDVCVIMSCDKVLGIYEQGEKEYVLVMEMPGDRQYSEDDEILINAYMRLNETLDDVIIKTDEMHGFTECSIEDLEWVQYESDWE